MKHVPHVEPHRNFLLQAWCECGWRGLISDSFKACLRAAQKHCESHA